VRIRELTQEEVSGLLQRKLRDPRLNHFEDDLIHNFLVHDLPLNLLGHLEGSSQDGGVAGVPE
jgi:hypothetical protein